MTLKCFCLTRPIFDPSVVEIERISFPGGSVLDIDLDLSFFFCFIISIFAANYTSTKRFEA